MNDDITTRRELILSLPWIVGTTIDQPPQPVAAEPAQPVHIDDTPAIRPWAKPLLTGSLVLAAIWLAGLALIILDGALFADAAVRGLLGLAGVPLCCLIAIGFLADPDHESAAEEVYFTLASVPSAQCTPSRHTITGRSSQ